MRREIAFLRGLTGGMLIILVGGGPMDLVIKIIEIALGEMMIIRKAFMAAAAVLLSTTLPALADSTVTGVSFNAKSTFYVDDASTLVSCGMVYTAAFFSDKQYATQIQLIVGKDGMAALNTFTSEFNQSAKTYAPVVNVNNFFKIGDAPPIKLDPYNLLTVPSDGMSSFSFKFDQNDIRGLTKAMKVDESVIMARLYIDKKNTVLVSGLTKMKQGASSEFDQCLRSMWR